MTKGEYIAELVSIAIDFLERAETVEPDSTSVMSLFLEEECSWDEFDKVHGDYYKSQEAVDENMSLNLEEVKGIAMLIIYQSYVCGTSRYALLKAVEEFIKGNY